VTSSAVSRIYPPLYDGCGLAAADLLFGLLPADLGEKVKGWWLEFEAGVTPEACFAESMDRQTYARMEAARTFDPTVTAFVDHLYAIADREGFWPENTLR
jgi:putative hydrolases of HD superfamily